MTEQKSNPLILYTGVAVSVIGVVLSTLLLCKHGFSDLCSSSLGCSIDGLDGCKELGRNPISKVGPFPIALFGLFYYAFLAAAFAMQSLRPRAEAAALLLITTTVGLALDGVLGYVNFQVILVPCILCAYTYLITFALFVLALTHKLQSFSEWADVGAVVKESGSSAVVGALLTLFVVGVLYGVGALKQDDDLIKEAQIPRVLADFNALKPAELDLAGIKSREGSENAYIIIQDFADFRCPHCLHASEKLRSVMKRWPGRIQIYYRHFPIDSTCNHLLSGPPSKPEGDWRCNGAQAAICAADHPGFPEFYHGIFDLQNRQLPISLEQLERLSINAGIPWTPLRNCMGSQATQQKLTRDLEDAKKFDIHSTPTLIVNNRLMPAGTHMTEWFLELMDALVYEREGKAAFEEYRARRK